MRGTQHTQCLTFTFTETKKQFFIPIFLFFKIIFFVSVKGSCIFFNLLKKIQHNVYMLFKNKDVFNIGPEYTNCVNFFMSMNHALLDDRTQITNVQ